MSGTCPNGGKWPGGPFKPDPPPELESARTISQRILNAVGARKKYPTLASAAEEAGLPVVVVQEVVDGHRWPDLSIISRLEKVYNTMLWVKNDPRSR